MQRLGYVDTSAQAGESSEAGQGFPSLLALMARPRRMRLLEQLRRFQVVQNDQGCLLRAEVRRVDLQLGLERFLIRIVDAREALQLSGAGFLIESLGVPRLTCGNRRAHVNLDKRQLPLDVQRTDIV